MQFTTTTTQKGQATIPALIRKKLGIKPDRKIVFELKNDSEASIKPVVDFFSFQGSVRSKKPFNIAAMDASIAKQIKKEYEESD